MAAVYRTAIASLVIAFLGDEEKTGSILSTEEARANRAGELLKVGEWNRIRVEAKGDTFTVWLNGEQVSHDQNATYAEPAPIGLQIHGGLVMKVEFRDLRVLTL
jgi:hypothetical protein